MSLARAMQIWRITGLVLAGIYVVAAFIGLMAESFDNTRTVFWVGVLGGSAVLVLVGQHFFRAYPGWSAAAVSIGAAAGALLLFWSILVPIAAAAVIALSVALARQAPPATA